MPEDKEFDKGIMHTLFGEHLCDGCKGLLVVAYVAPTQEDVSSFAASFGKQVKDEQAGLAMAADARELRARRADWRPSAVPEPAYPHSTRAELEEQIKTLSDDEFQTFYEHLKEFAATRK